MLFVGCCCVLTLIRIGLPYIETVDRLRGRDSQNLQSIEDEKNLKIRTLPVKFYKMAANNMLCYWDSCALSSSVGAAADQAPAFANTDEDEPQIVMCLVISIKQPKCGGQLTRHFQHFTQMSPAEVFRLLVTKGVGPRTAADWRDQRDQRTSGPGIGGPGDQKTREPGDLSQK